MNKREAPKGETKNTYDDEFQLLLRVANSRGGRSGRSSGGGGGRGCGDINPWKGERNLLLNTQSYDIVVIQNYTPLEVGTLCNSVFFRF